MSSLISGNFQNPVWAKPTPSRFLLFFYNIRYLFYVLLTVHLSIILVMHQLNAQILVL